MLQVVYEIDLLSRQADEMLQHLENMQNSFDPNVYMDDVEMMVALQVCLLNLTFITAGYHLCNIKYLAVGKLGAVAEPTGSVCNPVGRPRNSPDNRI